MEDDEIELLDVDDNKDNYSFFDNVQYKKKNNPNKYVEYANDSDRKYYGFGTRIYFYLVSLIILLFISSFFMLKAFNYTPAHTIDYSEKSNVDYKVYLKNNKFYEDEFLSKDRLYIASLINKIDINFDYDFFVNEKIDLNFDYEIVGKLLIQNEQKSSTYYEKDYVLLSKKNASLKDIKTNNIHESISIDYDYYNNLANSFKNEYKISPVSSLVVYFRVNKNEDSFTNLNNNSVMEVEIPLSKQSVSISLDYKKINNDSKLLKKSEISLNSLFYLIISIIILIVILVILIRIIKLVRPFTNKKSKYEMFVNKILRQYDRVIVNSNEEADLSKEKVKIKDFKELLDLRDMTKTPIKYYVVNNEKCYFYMDYDNKIYIYILKKVDYDKKK